MSLLDRFARRTDTKRPVLMITLLGVAVETYPEIIAVISRKFARRYQLVFVAGQDDFTPFLADDVIFETFPALAVVQKQARLMDWHAYLAGRWALLGAKWQPEKILSYGQSVESYLSEIDGGVVR